MDNPTEFALYLRDIPEKDGVEILMNGMPQDFAGDERGYLVVDRTWHPGDKLEVKWQLSPKVRFWQNNTLSVGRVP